MVGHRAWLLGSLLSLAVSGAQAAEPSAEECLASKGLRKLSSTFALSEEADFSKGVRQTEAFRRDLFDAQKELGQRQKAVEEKRKELLNYMQQRRQLREQLETARGIAAHNRVVAALNEVGDRILLLHESKKEEEAQQAALERVSQLTEQYLDQLLKTRELHDRLNARYGDLATDPAVQQALEQFNQAHSRPYALGPTSSFQSNTRRLVKLEEAVLSDTIELRPDHGGLWRLSVVLNGSHTLEMAVDTGASMLVLPAKAAEQAGLKVNTDDPKIQLRMADGRVVEGRLMVADKVRVGRFTVENVECAVMPAELGETLPLLGMSFLKHFTFKLDSATAKLHLARVEGVDPSHPAPGR